MTRYRLAVWGDPIAHSQSPALHAAAYGVLGLDWSYTRTQVAEGEFDEALSALDHTWRGLSLTMPLKERAHRAAASVDRHAELTGAVNTLLLNDSFRGFNTDVGGIVDALAEAEVVFNDRVRLLGAGATAASALVASAERGATRIEVRARRPERAAHLVALGQRVGVSVTVAALDDPLDSVELTIATLPGGTTMAESTTSRLAEHGGVLFDVAYAPWPSALALAWGDELAIPGHGMLLHQAVRQIRIFVAGDPEIPLPDEDAVVAAMRTAFRH